MTEVPPSYYDGDRRLAYRLLEGAEPALLFLPGYASDMDGAKALALDDFAQRNGNTLIRFDYSGTGSSPGRFEEGTLERWLDDVLVIADNLSKSPLILIGSSMGGWLALHAALRRPDRVRGILGIAAAPDFTEWGFSADQRAELQRTGRLERGGQLTTLGFWESGQSMLLLDSLIGIDCPVRLLHGDQDQDVPLDIPFRTMRALRSADVQLKVIKNGGHRLSEPHEIDAILRTVAELLERCR